MAEGVRMNCWKLLTSEIDVERTAECRRRWNTRDLGSCWSGSGCCGWQREVWERMWREGVSRESVELGELLGC
jgi:hypothetical protein